MVSFHLGLPVFHLAGTASPVNSGTSDAILEASNRTADPVIIITAVHRVTTALVGVWAVVGLAVVPVIAVIRAVEGDIDDTLLLHHLKEGIHLAVAATLGSASKRCDQAQGEN